MRKTVLLSLGFAAIGSGLQLAILFLFGFGKDIRYLEHLSVSLFGLILAAEIFGALGHRYLVRESTSTFTAVFIGSMIGWFALWFQAFFGSSVEFSRHLHEYGMFGNYIVKPVFWIMLIGTPFSLLLGGIFGFVTHDEAKRVLVPDEQ